MEYIHCYENENDFAGVYDTSSYTEPWASYIESGKTTNYNKNCLTFRIFGDGDIHFTPESGSSIEYKINNGTWGEMPATVSVSRKDIVKFRGWNDGQIGTFSGTTARFSVLGNIMSLVDFDNFRNLTTLPGEGIFKGLFSGCTELFSAKRLELPAEELTKSCYYGMFSGCSSLRSAPALPASALNNDCYHNMFRNCKTLTKAPELPALEMAEHCYDCMFYHCDSLKYPPELPATTLDTFCYSSMFHWSGLVEMPELPATTLAEGCYAYMFEYCYSLRKTTQLRATRLAPKCYRFMFGACKALTADGFTLPATELASECYFGMFNMCESLVNAPDLPAETLPASAYTSMFQQCPNVKYIKCLATDISASNCTKEWVSGVSSIGDFYYTNGVSWPTGINGKPANWRYHAI